MSENIGEKVVVINGASSGLGEATARFLSKQGAIVVQGARRTDRLRALANEITLIQRLPKEFRAFYKETGIPADSFARAVAFAISQHRTPL